MITYVDTSAAVKLLLAEAESAAMRALIESVDPAQEAVLSSRLLRTEFHRVAFREGIEVQRVDRILAHIELVDVTRSMLDAAAALRRQVHTLDAIHLATASAVGGPSAVRLVTYDASMASVATAEGFEVVSPR